MNFHPPLFTTHLSSIRNRLLGAWPTLGLTNSWRVTCAISAISFFFLAVFVQQIRTCSFTKTKTKRIIQNLNQLEMLEWLFSSRINDKFWICFIYLFILPWDLSSFPHGEKLNSFELYFRWFKSIVSCSENEGIQSDWQTNSCSWLDNHMARRIM